MTSTVRVASIEGIKDKCLKEFLKFTPVLKIESLTESKYKLSQETIEMLRAAIPQMVKAFEQSFPIEEDYDFIVIKMENTRSLVPLNEIVWDCEVSCDYYFLGMELVNYVQNIISAAHRKIIGIFDSYLIYRTNNLKDVIEDLHAIALLILNLREFSSIFEHESIRNDNPRVFYKNICNIFSECILIESDGKLSRLNMPLMEFNQAPDPKIFDEYKFITTLSEPYQELNLEFAGVTVERIIHTERTLDEFLSYLSRTLDVAEYEVTEICSRDFMSNIFNRGEPEAIMRDSDRSILRWMKLVKRCYEFVFSAIYRKLKDNDAKKSRMSMTDSDHDIPTILRDIRTIVSNIDVTKLPDAHISQARLYEVVSESIEYEMFNYEIKQFTIPTPGYLTKRATLGAN